MEKPTKPSSATDNAEQATDAQKRYVFCADCNEMHTDDEADVISAHSSDDDDDQVEDETETGALPATLAQQCAVQDKSA